MVDAMVGEWDELRQTWSRAVTSLVWGQWLLLDTSFRATQSVLATAAPGAKGEAAGSPGGILELALARARQGLAPPRELYQAPFRSRIDWSQFPDWARPCDPEVFEGCAHEG